MLYTDTLQTVILLIGSFFITVHRAGSCSAGWGELQAVAAGTRSLRLWRPIDDPDFPWLGILIGSPIVGIWYWCTDQYIVQRTLSAKNLRNARRGALFGGVLKVTPVLIFIIRGMLGFAMHERGLIELPMKDLSKPETVAQLEQAEARLPPRGDCRAGPRRTEPHRPRRSSGDASSPLVMTLLPIGLRGSSWPGCSRR